MIARFVVPIEHRGGMWFARAPLTPERRQFRFTGFSFGLNGEQRAVFELEPEDTIHGADHQFSRLSTIEDIARSVP